MIALSIKKKIRDVLQAAHFGGRDDIVDVTDGEVNDLHLRVISPKLAGMRPLEQNDFIWSILEQRLEPQEWRKITMIVSDAPKSQQKRNIRS
ncbi:MAG TPA: hypothetical protein VGI40_01375 [Pirellulaceae bacterium]|jgi:stress-induced morphogen